MSKNLSILALTGTLALGAFAGYQANERIAAQNAAPAQTQTQTQTQPESAPSAQMVPTLAPATSSYDSGRARTESEANTVQVVKERQDGLVYISVTDGNSRAADPFGFGLGDSQPNTGTGSGFFVNAQGDIITNNHVVEGATDITIRLHGNKKTYPARVVARAPDHDLALIRAEGLPSSAIKPLPLGDSSQLDVGLKAIAMGAPFDLDFSVSEGIISSVERTVPVGTKRVYQQVIQTDAAINPGNSGGPLLNSSGQVIGVNTQILTGGVGQSAGVGFAIPVNTVKKLLPELQAGKSNTVVSTPSLGVQLGELSTLDAAELRRNKLPSEGALISCVYRGSPAAAAGLQGSFDACPTTDAQARAQSQTPGDLTQADVITAIDGQPVTELQDLRSAVLDKSIGDTSELTVVRGGQTRTVTVDLKAFTFPAVQE